MLLIVDSITPRLYGSDNVKISMTQVSKGALCDSENIPIRDQLEEVHLLIENGSIRNLVEEWLGFPLPLYQIFSASDNIEVDEEDDVFLVKYDYKNKELIYWKCNMIQ